MKPWRERAKALAAETYALYLAYRDPRVPWVARVLAALVVGYALSPIDLIPDFIPILGYLDDLVLVPLGVGLVLRLMPPQVMAESRAKAQEAVAGGLPVSRTAAVVVVLIWAGLLAVVGVSVYRLAQ